MDHDRKLHLVSAAKPVRSATNGTTLAEDGSAGTAEIAHEAPPPVAEIRHVPVDSIDPSPFQTRELEEDEELHELKSSIATSGVIQPITVRPRPPTAGADAAPYELVAGERRLRAAKLAGMTTIPALVRPLSDEESLRLSVVENAQRANLNPIEEAFAFQLLVRRFSLSQNEVAKAVGKSRAAIANSLRLLQLDPNVLEMLKSGELSAGHGRALLMLDDPRLQARLGRRAARRQYSVRFLEALVANLNERADKSRRSAAEEREIEAERRSRERLEQKVGELLGVERVRLVTDPAGRRRVSITFDSDASWRRFLNRIRD